MNVFDSSALLCFVLGEPEEARVEQLMEVGHGVCSAANWSEVAQKTLRAGRDWLDVQHLVLGYDLVVEPVTEADAVVAAQLWASWPSLSLADRLCLATGERLDAEIWTCDTAWGTEGRVHQVR